MRVLSVTGVATWTVQPSHVQSYGMPRRICLCLLISVYAAWLRLVLQVRCQQLLQMSHCRASCRAVTEKWSQNKWVCLNTTGRYCKDRRTPKWITWTYSKHFKYIYHGTTVKFQKTFRKCVTLRTHFLQLSFATGNSIAGLDSMLAWTKVYVAYSCAY